MAALVQTGKYGAINTKDTATMGYYVIKFMSGQQPHYQPIKYFTYWNVLSSFNRWKILKLSHKETSS